MQLKTLTSILIGLLSATSILSQVMPYKRLPELPISRLFGVEIKQGNNPYQEVITYGIPNNEKDLVTKVEHLAMLAFEPESGPVYIKISSLSGDVYDTSSIELVNKMYQGVDVSYAENEMIIKVANPKKQLLVRLKKDLGNPLMIFVDPLKEREIPSSAKVFKFEARDSAYVQTAEFDRYTVPNDIDVVYIEDGALIKGTIHTDKNRVKPLTIMGRGVIIGNGPIVHGTKGMGYNTLEINSGQRHIVEGITLMKSRHFGLRVSDSAYIDNVKIFGYNSNNDGIVAGKYSVIENCFLKVNDDHIKIYKDYCKVRNCVFYAQTNGAIIQFAWNNINPGDYCTVENCEVVESEYKFCGDPALETKAIAHCFISLREEEADSIALVKDTIRNIIIQGQLVRFMGINGFSSKGIDIKGLVLQNINVLNPAQFYSWVYTQAPYNIGIQFKNVVFGNRPIAQKDFETKGNVSLVFDQVNQPYIGKMPDIISTKIITKEKPDKKRSKKK